MAPPILKMEMKMGGLWVNEKEKKNQMRHIKRKDTTQKKRHHTIEKTLHKRKPTMQWEK